MPIPTRIAIDGPSAAGKSVIGLSLAERLGYLYLDTGAMYRAIAWLALRSGIDPHDAAAVTDLAERYPVDIRKPDQDDGRQYTVLVDREDVTWSIREPDVEANVSLVSAVPGVRRALVAQQRKLGLAGKVVMVGRDIGTVVLPDAELKIYLVASTEERARRRYRELLARGRPADYEAILSALARRDKLDGEREESPLRPAKDAVIVDTDRLSAEEVMEAVADLLEDTA